MNKSQIRSRNSCFIQKPKSCYYTEAFIPKKFGQITVFGSKGNLLDSRLQPMCEIFSFWIEWIALWGSEPRNWKFFFQICRLRKVVECLQYQKEGYISFLFSNRQFNLNYMAEKLSRISKITNRLRNHLGCIFLITSFVKKYRVTDWKSQKVITFDSFPLSRLSQPLSAI